VSEREPIQVDEETGEIVLPTGLGSLDSEDVEGLNVLLVELGYQSLSTLETADSLKRRNSLPGEVEKVG